MCQHKKWTEIKLEPFSFLVGAAVGSILTSLAGLGVVLVLFL